MPTSNLSQKKSQNSTLTIRINKRLKYDVIAIARESGDDVSTWIRRFFEGIRDRKNTKSSASRSREEDDDQYRKECIDDVLQARKKGSFVPFDLADYV